MATSLLYLGPYSILGTAGLGGIYIYITAAAAMAAIVAALLAIAVS